MSENAFNPDNKHLWGRCERHNADTDWIDICIFVEGCDDCKRDCLHDSIEPDHTFGYAFENTYEM